MNVQPPASYSLRAAERLRRALFALAAGAAATASGQSTEPAAEADATETNRQAVVPRAVDLDARSLPMTPMMTTPRLTAAEWEALQNMTPRPLSTFSPEELEKLRERVLLTPRAIDIDLSHAEFSNVVAKAIWSSVATAAAGTATNAAPAAATNAVPAAAEAAAPQASGAERGEP